MKIRFDHVAALTAEMTGLSADTITPESRVVEDLNADSIDVVELLMLFEDEYDLSIPDEVAKACPTVGQIHAWLEANT